MSNYFYSYMSKYKKIPMDVSIHVCYPHQDHGEDLEDLILRYPEYSKTSFNRKVIISCRTH